jgi:hypothetical protein
LIVQEFLKLVRELIGLHRAHPVKNGAIARQIGIGGIKRIKMPVVEPVELEAPEDKRCGEGRDLVLAIRHELGARGVCRFLIVAQARERHHAPGGHVDRLITAHGVKKAHGIKTRHLALISGGEIGAGGLEPVHVLLKLGRFFAGIEIVEVPLWQRAEGISSGGIGVMNRSAINHRKTFRIVFAGP